MSESCEIVRSRSERRIQGGGGPRTSADAAGTFCLGLLVGVEGAEEAAYDGQQNHKKIIGFSMVFLCFSMVFNGF